MSDDRININCIVPQSVDKAIENIIDKPSKNIGNTFADIWFLVLGGTIDHMVNKRKIKYLADLEEYKKKVQKEIDKIPDKNRIEPGIQLVGRMLEASKYCAEKQIFRDMFAKLIASSVDIKKEKDVLPEFVDILKNMTKCMAEDIVYMKQHLEEKRNRFPLADIYVKTRNIFSELEFTEQSS